MNETLDHRETMPASLLEMADGERLAAIMRVADTIGRDADLTDARLSR